MYSYKYLINLINELPTDIYGLKFFPSLEPSISNYDEHPKWGNNFNIPEVTDDNLKLVEDIVTVMGDKLQSILEIGINRNGERSMSQILMHKKPSTAKYVGIDIDDRSFLDDESKLIFTYQCNSMRQAKIRTILKDKGMEKLDLLFIDGNHSVNFAVNDWMYADLLSDHGVVIMHDTNWHPGSVVLPYAIDESIFNVERYFDNNEDQGMTVCYKK